MDRATNNSYRYTINNNNSSNNLESPIFFFCHRHLFIQQAHIRLRLDHQQLCDGQLHFRVQVWEYTTRPIKLLSVCGRLQRAKSLLPHITNPSHLPCSPQPSLSALATPLASPASYSTHPPPIYPASPPQLILAASTIACGR